MKKLRELGTAAEWGREALFCSVFALIVGLYLLLT